MWFHVNDVSNDNWAEEMHTTHNLDGISCRQCQQSKSSRGGAHNSQAGWDFMQAMSAIKIKQRRCTQLTSWMWFHAGNVSNQNQAEEVHTTHILDVISCRQCQQSKSSRGGAHNSHPRCDFMQAMSAIKIKQRRCTQLTSWMGFYAGNVSNQNQAEEVHTTHILDVISCRQCQQSKSSRGGTHNSHAGWDFIQPISALINPLHNLLITSFMQYLDLTFLSIQFLPCLP